MAFNFYGTFTTGQFTAFSEFSKIQEQDLKRRIDYLSAQILRVGRFITDYNEDGTPLSFSVVPNTSYGAKLMLAYKILGGKPETSMLLRTRDKPVFLERGTGITDNPLDLNGGYSDNYSNGRLNRGTQRYDRDIGIQVEKMKNWQLETIKRKREALEFKIKKAMDLSDQLYQEREKLQAMIDDPLRSLPYIISQVYGKMFARGAMSIVDDTLDVLGLKIGMPVDVTSAEDYESGKGKGGRFIGG